MRARRGPPDLSSIAAEEPLERTRAVLLAFYRYYARTEKMWAAAYQDLEKVPDLAEPMAEFDRYLAAVRKDLLARWAPRDPKRLRATLGHALRFSTWRSLAAARLSGTAMADLVCVWVSAAAE